MAVKNWELARQDYLLSKQLQGVPPRTLSDYDGGTRQFVEYLEENDLPLTTATIRQFLSSLDGVGPARVRREDSPLVHLTLSSSASFWPSKKQ